MIVLAIDPGPATGMALWEWGEFRAWQENDPFRVADYVRSEALLFDEVVVEDFKLILGGRAKTVAGIKATIELIGMLRYVTTFKGIRLELQPPADARKFSTNEKLRAVNFATPAQPDHMRSAARHLLLRLVRNGTVDAHGLLP